MKGNSGNIKQYTTEDIQRYVRGEMTDQDMHAIEKAALEDQFLSDAIDGYAEAIDNKGVQAIEASSQQLHERLKERLSEPRQKKVVPVFRMKWWQGAVAASIIITAGVLGYRSYNDRAAAIVLTSTEQRSSSPGTGTVSEDEAFSADTGSSSRALTASPRGETVTDKAPTKTLQTLPAATQVNPNGNKAEIGKKEERELASARPPETSALYLQKETEAAINKDSIDAPGLQPLDQVLQGRAAGVVVEKQRRIAKKPDDKTIAPVPDRDNKLKAIKDANASNADMATAQVPKSEAYFNESPIAYYKGQIVTPDNKPLSNAVLKVASTNASYMTDNNGKFVIPSRDSVIDVNVSLVGSQSTSFRLQSNTLSNRLVMPEATGELAEVVVIGYGTARKKDITGSVTVTEHRAAPEEGWIAFEEYLEKNKDTALISKGTGETQVSFAVSPRNRLSDFKIIRSISPEHDREIIRLIQNGPKWKLLKGRKARVTVTVRF